jgi:hypothetical protein
VTEEDEEENSIDDLAAEQVLYISISETENFSIVVFTCRRVIVSYISVLI